MLGSVIWTLSNGQTVCDSSIAVCPKTFDYFIRQDILAKKYYVDNNKLSAQIKVLKYELVQSDSTKKSTSNILRITKEEGALTQKSLTLLNLKYDKVVRQVNWLKFGCVSLAVAGIVTTVYVAIKKP